MSFLEKLSIQGIRCFGPDESEMGIIKFGLPLTLILGNNGCGKTTIIEALNYATCGKLPPGCSGSSSSNFVHDPKLVSGTEVRGQVRLQLKDVKGQTVSVSRIVQVTQRASKATFKSVDQTVSRMDERGDWHILPGRCADADTEMCQALGVSKSVLSNVLLCHQEDSNWPLDEDTKVKTKFDEIFGSERYNKCLDELKSTMKKLKDDESKLLQELGHLEKYKSQASSLKMRLADQQERFETLQKNADECQAKMEPIQKRLTELSKKEDEISEHRTLLETYKAKLEGARTTIKNLRSSIQHEFKGSSEQLESALKNFEKEIEEKEKSLERLQDQDAEIKTKLDSIDQSLSTEQTRLGQLNGDLIANKRRTETRGKAILSLSEEMGMITAVSQVSQAEEVMKVISELEGCIMQKESEIDIVKERHSAAETALQKETESLREKRANVTSNISSKKEQLRSNDQELKKVIQSITEADQSAALLGQIQSKLDQNKKEYDELLKAEDVDSVKRKISSAKGQSDLLEEDLTKLEKQVTDLQLLSQVQAELDVQKSSKATKDAEIKKLKARHEGTLKEILQLDQLPEQGFKFQLDARMDQFADTIKTKTEQLRKIEKDIATKEAEHKHLSQRLKEAKQQLDSDDFAVQQACGGQDYDACVAELSEKLGRLQDEKGTLSSTDFLYRRYVQKLQKDKSCPVCKRGFDCDDGASNIVSELTLKIREVPAKLRGNKEQLDQTQEKYEKLLQLKSKHEKVAALKSNEIPTLENNLERSKQDLARLKVSRSEIQDEVSSPQTLEAMAKSIQSDISLLEQNLVESRRLAKEVAKLEDKLRGSSGTTKTLQEAINEQSEGRKKVQENRKKIADLENQLSTFEKKRMQLQEEKITLKDQQLKISGNSQRRAQLSERKDELEGIESMVQIELEQLKRELDSVTRQIEQSERKSRALHESNKAEANDLTKKFSDISRRFEDIKQLNSEIVEYELSGGTKKLEMCKQMIEKMHKMKDELNSEREMINNRCDVIKQDILTQESRKRDLKANEQLRTVMDDERKYLGKFEELDRKIGDMNLTSIHEERKKLKNEESRLYSTMKEAEGSLGELKKSIRSIKSDLEEPHMKNAEAEYCKNFVHAEVVDKAMKDLDNFYKALDWSMISYHKKKIKHINTVINELWRKVIPLNSSFLANFL